MQKINNPFTHTLVVPFIRYITDTSSLSSASVDEYGYDIEAESYTRLYNSKKHRDLIIKLNTNEREMFLALHYFVQTGNDYLTLTYEKMAEFFPSAKLSPRKYADTVRGLVKNNVIDLRSKGVYWYNPVYLCAGSRVEMFPECSVKKFTRISKPKKLS